MGFFSSPVHSQDMPEGWVPFEKINPEALRCANYSKREWAVSIQNHRLLIGPALREVIPMPFKVEPSLELSLRGRRHVKEVPSGWLIGSDAGEWGGGLWWFDRQGRNPQQLLDKNVIGMFPMGSEIWVLTGLAHLGINRGAMYRIEGGGSRAHASPALKLIAAPQAYVVEQSSSILVLTTQALVRVNAERQQILLETHSFATLYPNSMVMSDAGVLYVGMRQFVARLTPQKGSYTIDWFVPKDCRRFERRGLDCVCLGS